MASIFWVLCRILQGELSFSRICCMSQSISDPFHPCTPVAKPDGANKDPVNNAEGSIASSDVKAQVRNWIQKWIWTRQR